MNLTVNQKNLYLFLPSKVCRMGELMTDDKHIGAVEAIKKIYSSNVYKQLEKEDTKLWHLGPVDLYRDLEKEL